MIKFFSTIEVRHIPSSSHGFRALYEKPKSEGFFVYLFSFDRKLRQKKVKKKTESQKNKKTSKVPEMDSPDQGVNIKTFGAF